MTSGHIAIGSSVDAVKAALGLGPGSVSVADFLFTEQATGGFYIAELPVPAGTTILDMHLIVVAGPWAADTADFSSTLASDLGEFFFAGIDLVGGLTDPYESDVANQTTTSQFLTLSMGGANPYSLHSWIPSTGAAAPFPTLDPEPGIIIPTDDTLRMRIDSTIASPPVVPAGQFLVRVLYLPPVAATAAGFTAAP